MANVRLLGKPVWLRPIDAKPVAIVARRTHVQIDNPWVLQKVCRVTVQILLCNHSLCVVNDSVVSAIALDRIVG